MKTIYYLTPSSFCFGVERSIKKLEKIIQNHTNEKIFCIHELVHNPHVNQRFKDKWITFVEKLEEIKETNCVIVFSAHGTNREVLHKAQKKFKTVYNVECPLVTKIYNEIDQFLKQWINTFFYIGKAKHQEAQNVMNYIMYRNANLHNFLLQKDIPQLDSKIEIGVLSQTTLNSKYVKNLLNIIWKQYPNAKFPAIDDICKATYQRQEIINKYLDKFETLIVVGGKNSSNTKELVKIGENNNKKVYFIQNLNELNQNYNKQSLTQTNNIAITGGASTPAENIKEIFQYFQKKLWYEGKFLSLTTSENIKHFTFVQ